MATLNGIKLIIWDLDETLWCGTLSESSVTVSDEIREFIKETTDAGIVHSVCSKNDFCKAKAELEKTDLWKYFVFPSINWEPKGERIKSIISDMALRAINVLFLDDNTQNLKEAEYYCKDIKTSLPTEIPALLQEAKSIEKKDKNHSRLQQYRVLEEKRDAKQTYASNEAFLMDSDIRVVVHDDCLEHVDRLHELLMRSNQLNYTKFRQPKEELMELLNDKDTQSGYVTVSDKFGDYGIVGFFVVKNGKAIHYLFSCRTLGMLVEQWVYMNIGCPDLTVKGEVVTQLNDYEMPAWINQEKVNDKKQGDKLQFSHRILFKGPCDLLQMFSFINETENIVTEFTYTNDSGTLVEGISHTAQILSSIEASDDDKRKVLADLPWGDPQMLQTSWVTGQYEMIFLSMVTDPGMAVYRHRETGLLISMCERYYDITQESNWDDLIKGRIWNEDIRFTRGSLKAFAAHFDYVNNDDFSLSMKNIDKLYRKLDPKSTICLLLGAEKPYEKEKRPAYIHRHEDHARFNNLIRTWAKGKTNVRLYEMNDLITNQGDFVDSINHYSKRVYWELAEKIIDDIQECDNSVTLANHSKVYSEELKAGIKRIARRVLGKK